MQLLGAGFLLYLGVRTYIDKAGLPRFKQNDDSASSYLISRAATEGFLISLFNPKIVLFFLAIFSHFIQPDFEWIEIASIGLMAGLIDGAWYSFIAIIIDTDFVILSFCLKPVIRIYLDKVTGFMKNISRYTSQQDTGWTGVTIQTSFLTKIGLII